MTTFEKAFSDTKRAAKSVLKSALAIIAAALIITALACEDAQPTQPAPAPIAAATVVPTVTPAPPTPTVVPTRAPAPPSATFAPTPPWLPTAPTRTPAPSDATPTPIPTAAPTDIFAPTPQWLPADLPSSTPAPPTATPISATAAEARRIYEDAIAAMNNLSSYRLRVDLVFVIGEFGKMSIDIHDQPPDAAKWKSVIGSDDQAPVEVGNIFTGGYTYVKPSVNLFHRDDPNRGKWIRGDEESESQDTFASGYLSGIGADAVVGPERLDGVETRRLKGVVYSNSLGLGMYERMEADIWVGVADGLIRRVTASTSPDAYERVSATMIFSDFDVPIEVEAPKDYIALNTEHLPDIPNYAPADITSLNSGWTLAHLRDYGFSVSTPPNWSSFSANPRTETAYAAGELSLAMIQYVFPGQITAYEGDETGVSVFNATIIGTLGDAALSEYVDERMEQTEAALIIDGPIQRRTETLPAGEAEVAEFAFRFRDEVLGMDTDDDTDYAQIQYFILSEGDAFILTFATAADRIASMRPAFDEIAQTARIEPRP